MTKRYAWGIRHTCDTSICATNVLVSNVSNRRYLPNFEPGFELSRELLVKQNGINNLSLMANTVGMVAYGYIQSLAHEHTQQIGFVDCRTN